MKHLAYRLCPVVMAAFLTSASSFAQVIPDPPVVSGDEEACEGENTTFTANPIQGATVEWWDDAIGGTLLAETVSYSTPPLEVGDYDFYVNQVFEGVASQRSHVQLAVFAKPTISTPTTSGVFCQGDLVDLVFDGAWLYDVSLNGTLTDQVQNEPGTTQASISYTVNESTSFQVVGYMNGCQSTNTLDVSATVFDVPSPTDLEVCFGESLTIEFAPNVSPVNYLWSQDVFMDGNQATLSPSNNTSYNLTIVESSLGCQVELDLDVVVKPVETLAVSDDFTVTDGDKVELQATSPISPISWSTNHGNYGSLQGSNVVVVPTTQTTYTASITNVHGCQSSESVTVSVNHLPDISGVFSLALNGNETVQTNINADGTGPFQWYDVEAGGTPLQDSFDPFTTPPLTESKDFWVSDNGGPRKKVSVFVDTTSQITIEATNVDESFCESQGVILTPTFSGSVADCSVEWYQVGQLAPIATTQGTNSVVIYPEYGAQPSYYAVATCSAATASFDSPGRYEWTVPDGVTSIDVIAVGARGTRPTQPGWAFKSGAAGGKVEATLNVTPGQTLFLRVGGVGYNGGHNQSCNAWQGTGTNGGSGGATDIRINGEELTDRILVAGGGGGGQYYSAGYQNSPGGPGGGLNAGNGGSYQSPYCSNPGGGGGSQVAGGNGGAGGSFGVGAGCYSYGMSCYGPNVYTVWKNPGGGGWFGGGAGNGGGGGSSYTSDLYASNVAHQAGYGDRLLSITYGVSETILVSNETTLTGDGVYDECGVCNGPGAIYVCGCGDIPEGDCACGGLITDACGECGGTGVDSDGDGVCDSQEVYGCQDELACNYNEESTEHDMSLCQYLDGCGVCGGDNNCCQAQYSATSVSTSSCLSSEGEITAQVAGCEPILVSQPAITYLVQFLTLGDIPSCFNTLSNPESCWSAQSMVSWAWNSSSSWYEWLGEYNHEDIMSSLEYIMEQGSSTPHITAFYNWMSANSAAAQSCFNDGDCQQLFYSVDCCPAWNESLWNPDNYVPDIFVLLNDLNDLQTFSAPGCAATIAPVVDSSQCREVAVQLIMSSNYGPISFSLLDGMGETVEDINGSLIQDSFCDDGYIQSNGYIACSGALSYIQGNNPIFHACLTEGECYVVQMYAEQNGLCEGGGCTNPSSYDAWGDGYNAPYVRITDEEVGTAQNFTFYEGQEGSEDYCVIPYTIQPSSGNTGEGEFVFSGLDPRSYNVSFVTNYGFGEVACSGQLTVEIDCCENDVDSDGVCDDVDDCIGAYNTCGVCNGPDTYECGCSDIPEGDCDCDGNQLDALGVCGGSCLSDTDGDGVCDDEDECVGQYDAIGACNGLCVTDEDGDSICDDVDDCVGAYDSCGICNGPGSIYSCGCNPISPGDCDCDGNQLDALGVCGGDCAIDADQDGICDSEDDCVGSIDACGICNGPGAIYECGCSDIPAGDCDCDGNQLDALGVCGGDCAIDADQDGICDDVDDCVGALDDCGICMGDGLSCSGCTYIAAMNYNSTATIDNGTCTFNISDACPGDFNGDDYIGIDDILSMLTLYDTSCSE